MLSVYPDYYKDFKCINKNCKHNCCIGWEIDIDSDSFRYYKSVKGDFGQRLKNNIECSEYPHFILGENERCPFLNKDNLCDIIITLGEDKICDICKEHPRFHNESGDRTESGLGLCCEEAARIILSKKDPVQFLFEGEETEKEETIVLRDEIIKLLQNREKTIEERISDIYSKMGMERLNFNLLQFADFLLSLERLDEKWTDALEFLKENLEKADLCKFSEYMYDRQSEYEQLLVYIIYRHFLNTFDMCEMQAVVRFADLVYNLIFTFGAAVFKVYGKFDFCSQTEFVRMFSSEVEYSDENLEKVIGKLLFF